MKTPIIAVTGIDGVGKSSVVDAVLLDPSRQGTTLKLTRPIKTYRGGESVLRATKYSRVIDAFHKLGDSLDSKAVVAAANGGNMLSQSRILEPCMNLRYKPNSIWWARDRVVDPAVYSGYYMERTAGRRPIEQVVKAYRFACGKPAGLLFHLTVDPAVAVQRIDNRITDEVGIDVDRKKWRHMHETEEHLGELAARYFIALDCVKEMYGSKVITVATDYRSCEEVVDIVSWYAERYESGRNLVCAVV